MNRENKELLTVKETAEMIGVSPAYIRELLNKGKHDANVKLKGVKVGKEWRISTKSIYDYVGIELVEKNKKDIYIKELEDRIRDNKELIGVLKSMYISVM